jgi:hypothetical protein
LIEDLLTQPTTSLLASPNILILGRQSTLQKPRAHLASQLGLLVQALNNQDKRAASINAESVLIGYVQGGFVDEADIDAVATETVNGVEGSVHHLAVRHDVACFALANEFILAGDELVALAMERPRAAFLENQRGLGAGGDNRTDTLVLEDLGNGGAHLVCFDGEVETSVVAVDQAVVSEESVQTEMAGVISHVVDAGMGEAVIFSMTQDFH